MKFEGREQYAVRRFHECFTYDVQQCYNCFTYLLILLANKVKIDSW